MKTRFRILELEVENGWGETAVNVTFFFDADTQVKVRRLYSNENGVIRAGDGYACFVESLTRPKWETVGVAFYMRMRELMEHAEWIEA